MNESENLRAQIAGQLLAGMWRYGEKNDPDAMAGWVHWAATVAADIMRASISPPGGYGMVADHDSNPESKPYDPFNKKGVTGPPDRYSPDRLRFRATGQG